LKRASKKEKLVAEPLHNLGCTTQKKLASDRKFSISLTLSLLTLATGRLELLKSRRLHSVRIECQANRRSVSGQKPVCGKLKRPLRSWICDEGRLAATPNEFRP